jgi:predicted nucleotidyltransferase
MGVLLGTVLFGSVARGDDDELSDLDLLALVQNGGGPVSVEEVRATLPAGLAGKVATISWYGMERLVEMHRSGELFAWHIHLDGKVLHDPVGAVATLGVPAPYRRALDDVDAFLAIAADLPSQLERAERNAIYEFGVLYVCLRNVAMSASAHLSAQPDFTRKVPYRLGDGPPCPVSESEYRMSMLCRLASQRGLTLPLEITPSRVMAYHDVALPWMSSIRAVLGRKLSNG